MLKCAFIFFFFYLFFSVYFFILTSLFFWHDNRQTRLLVSICEILETWELNSYGSVCLVFFFRGRGGEKGHQIKSPLHGYCQIRYEKDLADERFAQNYGFFLWGGGETETKVLKSTRATYTCQSTHTLIHSLNLVWILTGYLLSETGFNPPPLFESRPHPGEKNRNQTVQHLPRLRKCWIQIPPPFLNLNLHGHRHMDIPPW